MSKFLLNIVSFSKCLYNGDVQMAIVPTQEGPLGILANHTPIVAQVTSGSIRIFEDNLNNFEKEFQIHRGFIIIKNNICEIYSFDTI